MHSRALFLVCCLCASIVAFGFPTFRKDPDGCDGTPNPYPLFTEAPTFVNSTPNGKLYRTGNSSHPMFLLHVYGTPYEKGFAHGQLLSCQIQELMLGTNPNRSFWAYIDAQIDPYLEKYVPWLRSFIDKHGVRAALSLVRDLTKPYTPQHFEEEIKGVADGSGVDLDTVMLIHMFPELIRAACTMFGAWGEAVSSGSRSSGPFQIRALDFGTDVPFRFYPVTIVHHPHDAAERPFVILSWTGFVSSIGTGMSDVMAVSEKKWYTDAPMEILPSGYPWHFLLRDILQFDTSVQLAEKRIIEAKKTASIFVGLSSKSDGFTRLVEYGRVLNKEVANIFNDTTPFPGYAPQAEQHPLMPSLVYIDKHTQPSGDWCMANVLKEKYGSLNAAAAIELMSRFQTGDIHAAMYDLGNSKFYASVASQNQEGSIKSAYDMQWWEFDTKALFSEKP